MNVAVAVPYSPGQPERDANWQWVRERWQSEFPDWTIVEGQCEGDWSKGSALAAALARTTADIVVVADADLWCDTIAAAVDDVAAGAPWVIPHRLVYRLSPHATRRVVAGRQPAKALGLAQPPYMGVEGGGLVVVPHATAIAVPVDPRFVGWGGEDISWGWALRTLAGPPQRLRGDLWHLWHPPQQRRDRRRGSEANEALAGRYRRALGDRDAMSELAREAREALWQRTFESPANIDATCAASSEAKSAT